MTTITQEISIFTGTPTNRFTQEEDEFSDNADYTSQFMSDFPPEFNVFAGQVNMVAAEVNANALSAADSATIALGAANYAGVWSSLTGALAAGQSVFHAGSTWMSLIAIADITLSEPSLTNTDWYSSTLVIDAKLSKTQSFMVLAY